MSEVILDPTEILIDRDGTVRTDTIRANHWLRFLGRMSDYGLFGLALIGVKQIFPGFHLKDLFETWIPLEFVVWMPIEALLLSYWGTTPGKWLVGTRIQKGGFEKLEIRSSFRRSFFVWFRGLGMGIIGINFICMLVAYSRLQVFKTTTWDLQEQIEVTHRPVGKWRIWTALALTGLGIYFA